MVGGREAGFEAGFDQVCPPIITLSNSGVVKDARKVVNSESVVLGDDDDEGNSYRSNGKSVDATPPLKSQQAALDISELGCSKLELLISAKIRRI